jgi:hypothetical protein
LISGNCHLEDTFLKQKTNYRKTLIYPKFFSQKPVESKNPRAPFLSLVSSWRFIYDNILVSNFVVGFCPWARVAAANNKNGKKYSIHLTKNLT